MEWQSTNFYSPFIYFIEYVGEGQQLQFAYFGDRINENQIDQVFDSWNGLSRPAYPVFGTSSYESSALQVVHADGNLTLDLIVDKVETLDEKAQSLQ